MLKNIITVTQEELKNLYTFTIQNNNNIIVFGSPGIGKTFIAQQTIDLSEYEYIYINLSPLETPDFVGIPHIKDGRSSWAPPEFLPFLSKDEKPKILLFDEIDKAAGELQSPLLEIFQFRSINGKRLNIQAVIATGNRQEDMSFSSPISHSLTNRSLVYNVEPEFNLWQKWARDNNINSLVVGFLDHNQNWLLSNNRSDTEYCFPSPRAWTYAANDIDNAIDSSLEFKYRLVAGRVGKEASDQFRLWLEHYKDLKPILDDLLYKGVYPDLSHRNINEERILICSISAVKNFVDLCNKHIFSKDQVFIYGKRIFGWLKTISPTYSVVALKSSLSINIVKRYNLFNLDEFNKLFDMISEEMEGY